MSQSKAVRHTVLLILAVVLFAAVVLWGYLDQNHYFYHVKTARITSGSWKNHEIKTCLSWNSKTPPPALECDEGHAEVQQTIPVRFYGDTRRELEPETVRLHWSCEKNEGSQQPVSCRIAAEP